MCPGMPLVASASPATLPIRYCHWEMPYNPDDLMVQCEECKDWFHPSCMGMSIDDAKKLEHFMCSECVSEEDTKRSLNGFHVSPEKNFESSSKPILEQSYYKCWRNFIREFFQSEVVLVVVNR